MMCWLRTQEFQLPPLATRTQCIVLDHFHLHWQCGKQRGRAWKIRSCDTAALLYCLCSSYINNIIQEAYPTTEGLQKQTLDKRQALIVAPETNCHRMAMTPEQAQLGTLFIGCCESDNRQQRYSLPLIPDHLTSVQVGSCVGVEQYIA